MRSMSLGARGRRTRAMRSGAPAGRRLGLARTAGSIRELVNDLLSGETLMTPSSEPIGRR